jgi:diadenosine tetraphosphate (Ap4A) HIT family hydrolase
MAFILHPQLEANTVEVQRLPLSRVLLMNDRTWPWLLVVPEREAATEVFDLDGHERSTLIEEVTLAATVLRDLYQPHKINVAALGNQVSQLHCHVIARFHHDPAWPRPVWHAQPPSPYEERERDTTVRALQDAFSRNLAAFPSLQPAPPADDGSTGLWAMFGFTDR